MQLLGLPSLTSTLATPIVSAPTTLQGSPTTTLATVPGVLTRKVKLNQVLDQGDDSEIPLAEDALVKQCFENYRNVVQGPAETDEEPSVEQLSAIFTRVVSQCKTPWADFAIFTPFARRLVKAIKFKAFVFQPDGSFLSKEIPGPRSFDAWLCS